MASSGSARRKGVERSVPSVALRIQTNEPTPKALGELVAIRRELAERITRKRRSIRAAFEKAGVPLAELLAEASSGTIRTFLEASEAKTPSTQSVRSLSVVLGLPPLAVAAALRNELTETQRFYLSVQLHRLDALAHALFSAEPAQFAAPGLTAIRRGR